MAKAKAAEVETTEAEGTTENTRVGALHQAHADYIKETKGIDVSAEQVFAVYSTRKAFRSTPTYLNDVKAAKAEAREAAEAAKAERAQKREEAKATREAAAAERAQKAQERAEAAAAKKAAAEEAKAVKAAAPKASGKKSAAEALAEADGETAAKPKRAAKGKKGEDAPF